MIIFWAEVNGFGDKLLGIVSSYLISKLLNIEYRIYWKNPFPLIDILLPNDNQNWHFDDYYFDNEYVKKHTDSRIIISEKSGHEIISQIRQNKDKNIIIDCIYPYYIFLYEHYKNEIFSDIDNIENTISYVFKTLFKIPKFINSKLISGESTLGIQIRTLRSISHDFPKISIEGVNDFIENGIDICKTHNINNIYLSCDCQQIINILLKNKNTIEIIDNNGNPKNINILYSDGESKHIFYDKFSNSKDKIKIILDLLNLSKCEKLLISHWSNYGRTSALLGNKNPYIIPFKIDINKHPQTRIWHYENVEQKNLKSSDEAFGISINNMYYQECPLANLLSKSSL